MKFKKLFASVLAIALATAAIPAAPANADVISGQAAYLNTEVYDTILPTTANQKFYLDPQGLSEIGSNNTPSDVPTNAAGKIVGKSTMSAINLSSRPVKMKVTYEAKVEAGDMDVEEVFGSSGSALVSAVKPKICLVVSAKNNSAKAVSSGATSATTLAAGNVDYVTAVASGGAATASTDGQGVQTYEFEQADYEVVTKQAIDTNDKDALFDSSNYKYNRVTEGASIELEIGGVCTPDADYSAFTGLNPKTLNLEMTFKFTKADASEIVDVSSATDAGGTVKTAAADAGRQVAYIAANGVDTSTINFLIDGAFSTNKALIYNDGSNIGLYYETLHTDTNHCVMTFMYQGTLYKQTMW